MKMIKKTNDFVLSILMLGVSAFLCFGKIVQNVPATSQGGLLARSDVWIRMIAIYLAIVAVILLITSINFRRSEQTEGFKFMLDSTIISTVVGLVLYTVLLPILGFFICTFAMTLFLVVMYTVREEGRQFRSLDKRVTLRVGLKGVITAAVLLAVFWFVFARLLGIQLPEMTLLG